MARRAQELTIDIDSFTPGEWATVREVMAQGGLPLDYLNHIDLTYPPVQVLSAFIFVTMRRTEPRITPGRCVRLAVATLEAIDREAVDGR